MEKLTLKGSSRNGRWQKSTRGSRRRGRGGTRGRSGGRTQRRGSARRRRAAPSASCHRRPCSRAANCRWPPRPRRRRPAAPRRAGQCGSAPESPCSPSGRSPSPASSLFVRVKRVRPFDWVRLVRVVKLCNRWRWHRKSWSQATPRKWRIPHQKKLKTRTRCTFIVHLLYTY